MPRPNTPGRPVGISRSREEILDAAESCFAEAGYAGTSIKAICAAANISQAMVNYHFGSKQRLFEEVYLRRGEALAKLRMDRLEALDAAGSAKVEELLRCYLDPVFSLISHPGGRNFLQLQAKLHNDTSEMATALRARAYDHVGRAYVRHLCRLLPHLDEKIVYLRFIEMVGVYLYLLSGLHRMAEFTSGAHDIPPLSELVEEVVAFCARGFLATS